QSSDNLSGRVPAATPVRAGLPRNIIQLEASLAAALLPSRLFDAPAVATRMVAAAAKIQVAEWPDFICEFPYPRSRHCPYRWSLEGYSTGQSNQHPAGFVNPIIPIRRIGVRAGRDRCR